MNDTTNKLMLVFFENSQKIALSSPSLKVHRQVEFLGQIKVFLEGCYLYLLFCISKAIIIETTRTYSDYFLLICSVFLNQRLHIFEIVVDHFVTLWVQNFLGQVRMLENILRRNGVKTNRTKYISFSHCKYKSIFCFFQVSADN